MSTKRPPADPDIEPEYDFRGSVPNPYAKRFSPPRVRGRPSSGDATAVTTRSGRHLADEDLDRLADEAEAGYDLSRWQPRRGRPLLNPDAGEASPRISVRVPAPLRDRAAAKAASEGRSMSDVLRGLLEGYAGGSVAVKRPRRR